MKLPNFTIEKLEADRRVLELLSESFPSISAASSEIINFEAITNLPKGTEHFVADLHGEHEAFDHILRTASGNIRRKVTDLFGDTLSDEAIRQLCTLIYYPERKLQHIKLSEPDIENFSHITLHQLVKVLREVSSKYTRSKVRKALPKEFSYIIEELLHETPSDNNKQAYYNRIIETIISTGQAFNFITAICNVIQRLSIDQLHILGDIYDRGPGAHIILDRLSNYHNFDMQWGNHDALWMGAAAGNVCCIANVIRLSLRFGNMSTLEDGYGINLTPLAMFALEYYSNDPCTIFLPKEEDTENAMDQKNRLLTARMHKAISILQFKLEAAMIDKYPQWDMQNRKLLHKIDFKNGIIEIDGNKYTLTDTNFPTIDPENPYKLNADEEILVDKLRRSFRVSARLRRHIDIFLSHGCMYATCNSNLLFHASLPLNEDGSLKEVDIQGTKHSGRDLLHTTGMIMRAAFNPETDPKDREFATDYYWYLWCGPDSPLFDKSRMATFERYFVKEKETHYEGKGYYYQYRNQEETCDMILDNFGVEGEHRHIINGHVPVKAVKGESPIRANGKMMVIDGGFAKAYHQETGLAGYTLVYHSRGFQLVKHAPFTSVEDAVINGTDIVGTTQIIELNSQRLRVKDTDNGKILCSKIVELTELLHSYRLGLIKER